LKRREFNSYLGLATLSSFPLFTVGSSSRADIPRKKGAKIVVVGGGWSGLSIAKYLNEENIDLDVILVERDKSFFSLPLSNLWLTGLLPRASLNYRFEDAAKKGGYQYFNAEVSELDQAKKQIGTNRGWINYDILVLAPGVEYEYGSIGVNDIKTRNFLRETFPAGFVSVKEQEIIIKQLDNFKKGLFILTAPAGIYRCAASPYERACLIAALFQKRKVKGKVLLIDPREKPAVNSEGFLTAFEDLYGNTIEYMPSTVVEGVNPFNKALKTDFDEIKFDGAAIYPSTRAATMIERFGFHDLESHQGEANIDPFNYNVLGQDSIYITGDCRPMPFSKSASVANSEGRHVAKVIVAKLRDKTVNWVSPESVCYSMVNTTPNEAILSHSLYKFDKIINSWIFHPKSKALNTPSELLGIAAYDWGRKSFSEIFGQRKF